MKQAFDRILRAGVMIVAGLASLAAVAGAYEDMLNAVSDQDVATVDRLLKRGMDVETTDPDGNTLLMLAAREGRQAVLQLLLSNRASPLRTNKYGDSALMLAAIRGDLQTVVALVAAGAEINPGGWTPLIYASFAGHPEIAHFLLTKGADVDAHSANGTTALMAASQNGHLEIVKELLIKGADASLTNQDHLTAADLASAKGHTEIASLLSVSKSR